MKNCARSTKHNKGNEIRFVWPWPRYHW